MKNYCQCCGKYRFVKNHDGLNLCAACVRKIRAGKTLSVDKIKKLVNKES